MIGNSKDRAAIAALQEAVRSLATELSNARADITSLFERHIDTISQTTRLHEALATLRDELRDMRTLADARHADEVVRRPIIDEALQQLAADRRGMGLMIAAHTEQLEAQHAVIAEYVETWGNRIKQCQAAVARVERQSLSDLTELRETNAAFASVLLRIPTKGALSSTE